jgi:hypothetical protein
MSNDPAHLREIRDALRLVSDRQKRTLDQLLQRSAVLLGAASVLAGLLAVTSNQSSTPTWRQWTTGFAFVALLASLFAGIVAVWPRQVQSEAVPIKEGTGVETYARMVPDEFLREQCNNAFEAMTSSGYAGIIKFRRCVFKVEAVALVIGGVLVALNSLVATLDTNQMANGTPHHVVRPIQTHTPAVAPASPPPACPPSNRTWILPILPISICI